MRTTFSSILRWFSRIFSIFQKNDDQTSQKHETAKPLIDSQGELTPEGRKRSNSIRQDDEQIHNPLIATQTKYQVHNKDNLDSAAVNGLN